MKRDARSAWPTFWLQDRAERFDLASPPLLRFTLIRLAASEHRLVLTNHHILMDGWSMPVAGAGTADALCAQGRCRGAAAGDALSGLSGLACGAGSRRARCGLAGRPWPGWRRPRVWRRTIPAGRRLAPEQIMVALSEPLTAALTAQARRQGLTLNTLIQTAWAILLGRLTGRDDVVFGVTVAGRPPEIAGIESMVGLFINTLPLRVKLPPAKPLRELLQEVQDSQSRLMAHQHLGLAEIQRAGRDWASCSTPWWCSRTTRSIATSLSAESGGLRLARRQRARCDALSAEPDGDAGRAAAAAARLSTRPV